VKGPMRLVDKLSKDEPNDSVTWDRAPAEPSKLKANDKEILLSTSLSNPLRLGPKNRISANKRNNPLEDCQGVVE